MTLWAPILTLALAGPLSALLRLRGSWALLWALVPAVGAIWIAYLAGGLSEAPMLAVRVAWFEQLGAGLDLRLDGWSALMAILVCGVGAMVVVYAHGYLGAGADRGRFLLFLFGFMAAMLGLVLSDNIMLLFVFWELTSITSYLLIGFEHERAEARGKALQALLVTGTAGLALLAGLVLMGLSADAWRISELVAMGEVLRSDPNYPLMVSLILLGAMAKSAQVPLHFWLPNAMAAPTPVSAFLHSATMVKAGVFLLAALAPALGGTLWWHAPLITLGALTLLTGTLLGLVQTDLKRILAYTTLAVLGALTLLLGLGTDLALKSLVVFLLGHALYKAALFMVAGTVDHETGTREVRALGGLRKVMPFTAAAALLAALSKAGFPPFLGFIGKEYVYKSGTALDAMAPVLVGVMLVGNILLFALALKAGLHPFWSARESGAPEWRVHEGAATLWAPPLVLALAGLVLGLLPGWVSDALVLPAASVLAGHPVQTPLALWHGLSVPLALSVLTMVGGILVYRQRRFWWRGQDRVERISGPLTVYESGLRRTVDLAKRTTRAVQQGALSHYVFVVVLATAALVGWKFARFAGWPDWSDVSPVAVGAALAGIAVAAGALLAAGSTSRLHTLLGLGVVGLGGAYLFYYYSAPDLAITQLLVESLTVLLLVMVLHRLPDLRPHRGVWRRWRDRLVAAALGAGMALLVLKAMQVQLADTIAGRLSEWSYAEAYGRNVVNVILVDFRALDTLGEIIVLAIAALGVTALLRRPEPRANPEDRT